MSTTAPDVYDHFDVFVTRYQHELSRLAYLITGDHRSADEATAEAFLATAKNWDAVCLDEHPVRYSRRVLLATAAQRAPRTAWRHRPLAVEHGDWAAGDRGLLRLTVRQRSVVALAAFLRLSDHEIADLLNTWCWRVAWRRRAGFAVLARALDLRAGQDQAALEREVVLVARGHRADAFVVPAVTQGLSVILTPTSIAVTDVPVRAARQPRGGPSRRSRPQHGVQHAQPDRSLLRTLLVQAVAVAVSALLGVLFIDLLTSRR